MKTLLFVPASNARAMEKAAGLGADALIFDLEDAVAPGEKAAARESLRAALTQHDYGNKTIAVRLNGSGTEAFAPDIALVRDLAVNTLVLPKVERMADLGAVGEALEGSKTSLWAMVETPSAVLRAGDIAAHESVKALIAGTNDLALALGVETGGGRAGLQTALHMIILGARAGGCAVFDGVYNDFSDTDGFAAECKQGKAWGFDGKTLIHPSQIAPCNAVFAPTEAEVAEARALIAAYEAAEAEGKGGAVSYKGRMIEALHVEAAKRVLGQG